jgi:hypothetical protein
MLSQNFKEKAQEIGLRMKNVKRDTASSVRSSIISIIYPGNNVG